MTLSITSWIFSEMGEWLTWTKPFWIGWSHTSPVSLFREKRQVVIPSLNSPFKLKRSFFPKQLKVKVIMISAEWRGSYKSQGEYQYSSSCHRQADPHPVHSGLWRTRTGREDGGKQLYLHLSSSLEKDRSLSLPIRCSCSAVFKEVSKHVLSFQFLGEIDSSCLKHKINFICIPTVGPRKAVCGAQIYKIFVFSYIREESRLAPGYMVENWWDYFKDCIE